MFKVQTPEVIANIEDMFINHDLVEYKSWSWRNFKMGIMTHYTMLTLAEGNSVLLI